jgi:hypothetical protein
MSTIDAPEVIDRREGPYGEVVLRRHGELLQIIANGCFLMDTSDGRSERPSRVSIRKQPLAMIS